MPTPSTAPATRRAKLFRNGRNQAVRIPVEFELPGDEVLLRREGERLVIEPIASGGLIALLDSWGDTGVDMPEIPQLPLGDDDPFKDFDVPDPRDETR
jgi:antitoxin VapB